MKKKHEVTEELIETPVVEEVPAAEEDSEKTGVVTCAKLNVREKPSKDSKILIVINEKTEVIINLDESTEEFYKVYVLGYAGYCVKQFIQII